MPRRSTATRLATGLLVLALALVALRFATRASSESARGPLRPSDAAVAADLDARSAAPPELVRAEPAPAARQPVVEPEAAPTERLVRGRVRDTDGAPVEGAWVTATFARPQREDERLELTSDARGRFEWSQPLDSATFTLVVRALGHAGRKLTDLSADETDLEVVLEQGWFLHASERDVALERPELAVQRGDERVLADVVGDLDGPFRIGPLAPGRYALTCSYPWSEERLVIEELDVLPGRDNRDPRLDPLDLSRFLTTVELLVVDERGAPVPGVFVTTDTNSGFDQVVPATETPGGALIVDGGPPPLVLRLQATGFLPLDIEADGDRRIVMRRGPELRLVLAAAPEEVPEGWELAPHLGLETALFAAPLRPARFVGGVADVAVEEPGRYRFSYDLLDPRGNRRELTGRRGAFVGAVLDVVESGPRQLFVVQPPSAEVLRRAIAGLKAVAERQDSGR